MQFTQDILPYVQGEKFGGLVPFEIEQTGIVSDRMDFVEKIVRGKSIIHVGCLDHLPMIKQKVEQNRWFHTRLTNAASKCLGVDISQEGIDFVKSEINISNICYGRIDGTEKIDAISSQYWDFIVLGEMLEHVDNPVDFLQNLMNNYRDNIGNVIITVPNAFRAGNIKFMFKNTEAINTDHRYWFSPYTICKVVNQAGLKVHQIEMCKYSNKGGIKGKVKDFFLKKYPLMAEDIVLVCGSK